MIIGRRQHYVRFSQFYWHFLANLVMHICSMFWVCILAILYQGPILNLERSYATFGTKIPVFRANSGSRLGKKWWIYKNVSRIVKIEHSATTMRKVIIIFEFLFSLAFFLIIFFSFCCFWVGKFFLFLFWIEFGVNHCHTKRIYWKETWEDFTLEKWAQNLNLRVTPNLFCKKLLIYVYL